LSYQSFRYAPFPIPHQQPTLAVGITPRLPFHKHRSTNRKYFLPNSNRRQKLRQALVLSAEVTGCSVPAHFLLPPSLNSQTARGVPVVPPSTCCPYSKKPMKIITTYRISIDEVISTTKILILQRLLFVFPPHGSRLFLPFTFLFWQFDYF